MIVKNKQTAEDRAFWAHCEAVAAEVKSWPKWMGGDRGGCDRVRAVRHQLPGLRERTPDPPRNGFMPRVRR